MSPRCSLAGTGEALLEEYGAQGAGQPFPGFGFVLTREYRSRAYPYGGGIATLRFGDGTTANVHRDLLQEYPELKAISHNPKGKDRCSKDLSW